MNHDRPKVAGSASQLGLLGYPRQANATLTMGYMDGDIYHSVRVEVPNEAVGHILVAVQGEVSKARNHVSKGQEAFASQAQTIRASQ